MTEPQARAEPLISVEGVHTYYGKSHILNGVSLEVGRGEVVGLIGRNGVGKSTTLKTIMGLVQPAQPAGDHGLGQAAPAGQLGLGEPGAAHGGLEVGGPLAPRLRANVADDGSALPEFPDRGRPPD